MGFSGEPGPNAPPGQSHLAVIHRGWQRFEADRLRRLRTLLPRLDQGSERSVARRRHAEARQRAATEEVGRLQGLDPARRGPDYARRLAAAQVAVGHAQREIDAVDARLTQDRLDAYREGVALMQALRASLKSVRTEAEAARMADALRYATSAEDARPLVRPVAIEFFRMARADIRPASVTIVKSGKGRASAAPRRIDIADVSPVGILHELGHLAEFAQPPLYRASVDWRRARALRTHGEERSRPLGEVDPDGEYEAFERAIEDEFYHPYVGAQWEHVGFAATEVFTTGLQYFHSAPLMLKLFQMDPEQFLFVVGGLDL